MSVNSDLLLTDSDVQIQKSNLHSTRGITPKRVASREAHLRGLGPRQHSFEETSQRWQAVEDTVPDLTCPRVEPQTSRTDSDVQQLS